MELSALQIGSQIQFFRKRATLSQDVLAKKAEVPYVTLTKIEEGVIESPSFLTVAKLARALGVTFEELIFNRRVSKQLARFEARGEGVYVPETACTIDLSLTSNPLGYSKLVRKVILHEIEHVHRYPDPKHTELRRAISRKEGVPEKAILFGTGADGVIENIVRAFLNPGEQMIMPELSFPDAAFAAQIAGVDVVYSSMTPEFGINVEDIYKKLSPAIKMVFLCNPNNPTGQVVSKEALLKLVRSTDALIVVDEANIEFAGESLMRETQHFENLIVVRTFSKAHGLAGMRIGYCVASQDLAYYLWRLRPPFVNTHLAQKAALVALQDQDHIRKTCAYVTREREYLMKEMIKRGFVVIPSRTNCFLVRVTPIFESSTMCVKALEKRDCGVVNGTHFKGLGDEYIRVAPQRHEMNQAFLRVIDDITS